MKDSPIPLLPKGRSLLGEINEEKLK